MVSSFRRRVRKLERDSNLPKGKTQFLVCDFEETAEEGVKRVYPDGNLPPNTLVVTWGGPKSLPLGAAQ